MPERIGVICLVALHNIEYSTATVKTETTPEIFIHVNKRDPSYCCVSCVVIRIGRRGLLRPLAQYCILAAGTPEISIGHAIFVEIEVTAVL